MKRLNLTITDCMTIDGNVVIRGFEETSPDLVEIIIPLAQIPAVIGVLPQDEPEKPKKKGGKHA